LAKFFDDHAGGSENQGFVIWRGGPCRGLRFAGILHVALTARIRPMPATPRPASTTLRALAVVALLVVAACGAFLLKDQISFDALRAHRESLLALRAAHPALTAAGFVGVYIAIVALSLPGAAVASVTGGFLFGLVAGVALNVTSATIGACAIFLAARWGLGDWLAARIDAGQGRAARLRQGLRDNEISVLLLLRLLPAVPFFVANLMPALGGARFRNFAWTTAVGILPGAIVFTWIGVGLGAVFDRGGTPDLSLIREPFVLGPILGLCALAALPMVVRAWRRERT
jgi:uncharacterized membrane protein YdjX (TVP38/TMEM64 family)